MITPEYIKELVEKHLDIDNLDLLDRGRGLVEYRMICYRLCKVFCSRKEATSVNIGRVFKRNHASVLHSVTNFKHLYNQKDFKETRDLYDSLCVIIFNRNRDKISYHLLPTSLKEVLNDTKDVNYSMFFHKLSGLNTNEFYLLDSYLEDLIKQRINNLEVISEEVN